MSKVVNFHIKLGMVASFVNMEMGLNTNLTVAKICHEMANYLIILNFIREDIEDSGQPEVMEMLHNIELMTYTMDFFRNIYTDNINPDALMTDIEKICAIKGVNISIIDDIILTENVKIIVCGILYIIMKVLEHGDTVNITKNVDKITVVIPGTRNLPLSVSRALSKNVDDDIFNVFVNYINALANLYEYKIELINQEVIIWKK